jgi:hypothetical protein
LGSEPQPRLSDLSIEELQAMCREIQNRVVVNDSVINQWHKEANQ